MPDLQLLAARHGEATALDGGSVQWRTRDDATSMVLTAGEFRVLAACAQFAPRELHLQRLVASFSCTLAQAGRAFDALVARGLIANPEAMLEGGTGTGTPAPLAPEPLIAIRSYQRPEGLRNLLDSLLADERAYGVSRRYVVIDDTLSSDFAAATRGIVLDFAQRSTSRVALLGLQERGKAIDLLLEGIAGETRAALLEMLDPASPTAVTGSRTWNWAVLLGAGGTLSILDDDTTFPLRMPHAARGAIDLLDANEPVARYFDDDGAAQQPLLPCEPYAYLREWLGQPTSNLLRRHGHSSRYLLHRTAAELEHLRGDSRVLGVVPGTWGSIPLDSSVFLTLLGQASQADLWRAPYRHERLEADRVSVGFEAPRLTSFASYTPLLLDDRELLPFAGTWGRVDDTLFLSLAGAIEEQAAFAHVPAMLGHRDYAPRARLAHSVEPLVLDRNAWLGHKLAQIGAGLRGPGREERLRAVGKECTKLAATPEAALRRDVLEWRAGMRARVTQHLAAGLERYGTTAPQAWREHAERIVAVNTAASLNEELDERELQACRAALRQLANVAPEWPRLWARAADLGMEHMAADAKKL